MACCHTLLSTPLGYSRSHDRSRRVALLNPSQKISSLSFVTVSMNKTGRTSFFSFLKALESMHNKNCESVSRAAKTPKMAHKLRVHKQHVLGYHVTLVTW